ncbi:MAG: hypothetical protein ACXW2C_11835 [Acidimicrobiia bacterium]
MDGLATTSNVRVVGGPDAVAEPAGSAFASLAAVVEHAATIEVPDKTETAGREPCVVVHPYGPEPGGSYERRKRETLDALLRAEAAHGEALDQADAWWKVMHEREQRLAVVTAEEASAFVAWEVIRERRRIAERELRRARHEAEAASHRGVVTSRDLEDARHRAARL